MGNIRMTPRLATALLTSTMLFPVTVATAATSADSGVETVMVTAQKRAENLQKVPISVQVLDSAKLEQLNISKFNDYINFLPTVSYESLRPG